MAEFRVIIEGLDLDEKTTRQINDSIQKVVLDHLADIDITTGRNGRGVIGFRPRPDWYGLVAQVVAQKELRKIAEVEQLMGRLG